MILKIILCILFIILLLFAIYNIIAYNVSKKIMFKGGEVKIGNNTFDKRNYVDFQCSIIKWLETYNQFCIYDFGNVDFQTNEGLLMMCGPNKRNNGTTLNIRTSCIKFIFNYRIPEHIACKIMNYELIYMAKENQEIKTFEDITTMMNDLQKDTIICEYGIPTEHRFIDYFDMMYVYYLALLYYCNHKQMDICGKFTITRDEKDNLTFKRELQNDMIKIKVGKNKRITSNSINELKKIKDINLFDIPNVMPTGEGIDYVSENCQVVHPSCKYNVRNARLAK